MQDKITRLQWLIRSLGELQDDPARPWTDYSCIEWPFSKDESGRGKISNGHGVSALLVYRKVREMVTGEILPPDVKVCHHCDNPSCFRPVHLFKGTQAENLADMRRKGRNIKGVNTPWSIYTDAQVAEAKRLHATGVRPGAIADTLQMNKIAVSQIMHGKIWKHIAGETGELNKKSKLTADDVRSIRRHFSAGMSIVNLSALYSQVSYATIRSIVRGASWKSLV